MNITQETRAVIDIGSSAIKYGVYDFSGESPVLIAERDPIATSLGRNLNEGNPLPEGPRDATLAAAQLFHQEITEMGARLTLVCATEAVRRASDQEEFLQQLRNIFGESPKIVCISAEKEVAWGLTSALTTLSLDANKRTLFIDPGGSSNDISMLFKDEMKWMSLPFGMNDLLAEIPADEANSTLNLHGVDHLRLFLRQRYDDLMELIAGYSIEELVGTSGAALAVAAVKAKVKVDSRFERIQGAHGLRITKDEISAMVEEMSPLTAAQRRTSHPCLSPTRSTIFVHGALIYEVLLDLLKLDSMVVNGFGMKLGGLIEIAKP